MEEISPQCQEDGREETALMNRILSLKPNNKLFKTIFNKVIK